MKLSLGHIPFIAIEVDLPTDDPERTVGQDNVHVWMDQSALTEEVKEVLVSAMKKIIAEWEPTSTTAKAKIDDFLTQPDDFLAKESFVVGSTWQDIAVKAAETTMQIANKATQHQVITMLVEKSAKGNKVAAASLEEIMAVQPELLTRNQIFELEGYKATSEPFS